MSKSIWGLVLWFAFAAQILLAMIAEFNGEYTRAIYEMMWAMLLAFLVLTEKTNE